MDQVTLHQGAIESIFLDSMHTLGVSVNRPFTPVSIELSEDKNILEDLDAYPVKVCHFQMLFTDILLNDSAGGLKAYRR